MTSTGPPGPKGNDQPHAGMIAMIRDKRLRRGKTSLAQSEATSDGLYPALYTDPAKLEVFVKGMTASSQSAAKAIASKLSWHTAKTVLDLGTAQGGLLVEIAKAHPHLTGIGFDLPQIQQSFEAYVRRFDLVERLRFHAGDFITDPLPNADVIIMGRVLHNWDLATKKMLLTKAIDALTANGLLVVCERLIDDERRVNAAGLLASLNMMIMTPGGFDFSGADCTNWMRDAGFGSIRVEMLSNRFFMIVGKKGT